MTDTAEAKTPPRQASWHRIVPYAAPALVLLALVVPYLRFNEYSLLKPESLILMAGALIIGVSMGSTGQLRPKTLGPMMLALTLGFYLFYRQEVTDFLVLIAQWGGDRIGNPAIILGCLAVLLFLGVAVATVLMRKHADLIVCAVFGTMVLSTLVLPTDKGGEPVSTGAIPSALKPLPPIIHIILDEHIGLAGLPDGMEESGTLRRAITSTYKDFALYSHAYSRFAETKFAFTSLMNGDVGTNVANLIDSETFKFTLKENDWFDALKAKGYAVKVYQSAWYDMCAASKAVDACYTYGFFSPNAIQRTNLPVLARLRALTHKLLIGRGALQMEPLVGTEAFMRFRSDIEEDNRGVAYVVHLLTTHYGYLYKSDCTLRDPANWEREGYGDDQRYTAEERGADYRRYLEQATCAAKQMDALFAQLKRLGIYDEATIIIHGDHGSRLGERPYIIEQPELLTKQDLLDHYSTLLAIKAPGITAGVLDEPVVLQNTFAKTFLPELDETSAPLNTVFMRVDDEDNFKPVEFVWPIPVDPVAARQEGERMTVAEQPILNELRR
jgi:hypothetical protein